MSHRSAACVIFNPAAGKHRARARLAALQHQYADRAVFWPTERAGHASELARTAVKEGYAIVAAAGGDGTVHEVANGILDAGDSRCTFAIIPIGSANDYVFSLQREYSTWPRVVDVGVIRAKGRQEYFVCCLGIGFSGSVTAESRRIKWLQGRWLYGLATLRALWRKWGLLDLSVSTDGKPVICEPTLMLSVMVGQREGGFLMAPDARFEDGLFDIVRADGLSRWEVLRLLSRLALRGLPRDHSKLSFAQCKTLRATSQRPMAIHVDGELFSESADAIHDIEIELLEKKLQVQVGLDEPGQVAANPVR